MSYHKSVLLSETVENLNVKKNGIYFDGTLGFGGLTNELVKLLGTESIVVGTDKDKTAFEFCQNKFKNDNCVKLYKSSFTNIDVISKIEFIDMYDGITADLGVSSFQLDNAESGFSFKENAKLDFRMDKTSEITAAKVLNTFSEKEIADIIYNFGEEKSSRRISKLVVEARKIKKFVNSEDLVEIIRRITPENMLNKSLSRVFQALRIYVNNELGELESFLKKSVDLLKPGGRIAIISFHSLEDRIVKEFFKYEESDCICPPESPICNCNKEQRLKIITKKPIVPSEQEVKENRRSRSAKLRVAEKI
jgi:16S rRNA (cytosine1402-N4)-methyltransferase